ncbi:hypothetical protein DFH09DRAFT_1229502 [Mycena vulgaris]|nr:hypothetical protein DFH09DRAFT_1229502 [Mycena vulgaris]
MSSETHTAPGHDSPTTDIPPITEFQVNVSARAQMAALDNTISWHYTQISMLKAKRNSLAPICSLPNELLSRILTIYAVESKTLSNLKWTKIMLVCHHWHDLALAAHSLWAFIELGWNHRDHFRMWRQIDRSGVAPLTVKIDACDSSNTLAILQNSERLYSVELAGKATHILDFASRLPQHNFPILRRLYLDPQREEILDGAAIADSVFNGAMPCLRELSLKFFALPWRSLRGLERLALTQCSDSTTSTPPTFDDLLNMLASSPQLQTLKLDQIIPPPILEKDYPIIDVANLSHIHLRDHVDLCATLLAHLNFPSTTQVALYPSPVRSGVDVRQLLIPIRKHVRAAGAPIPKLLQLECPSGSHGVGIGYFLTTIRRTTSRPNILEPGGLLSLNSHPINENGLRQIMAKVLKALPCEGITHLDTGGATHLTETSWKAALQRLPALEMVYLLCNVGASTVLRALLQIERSEPAVRQLYPRVRSIHLFAAVWKREGHVIQEMLLLLKAFLVLCHDQGTPVQVLEIEELDECLQMEEDQWEELFALVGRKMIRNGAAYDPVERRKMQARWDEELGKAGGGTPLRT